MIVMREIQNVKQNAGPARKPQRIGRIRRNEGREKGYEMPGEICGFRAYRLLSGDWQVVSDSRCEVWRLFPVDKR